MIRGAVLSIEWCPCGQCAMIGIDTGISRRYFLVKEVEARKSFVLPGVVVLLRWEPSPERGGGATVITECSPPEVRSFEEDPHGG